ncbi:NAD(P)H-dependent glycerol-3-phosphate dehydrogenase [Flavobacteriales bacterium]|nr:NAD(P)H-dependent glycerol-3-phosphate dehydrogenase [Flavobacteriales bacterium]
MAKKALPNERIGIIGSGSWATALAHLFAIDPAASQQPVNWWVRRNKSLEHISKTGHNPNYLRGLSLPLDRLNMSTDIQHVVDQSDLLILAIPSAYLDGALRGNGVRGLEHKTVFNAIKGLVTDEHLIPARYLHKVMGVPYDRIGLIAGPSHSEEVAQENWTYLTTACSDQNLAQQLAERLANPWLRTHTTDDVFGIELAAVLKNIYAVAAGIAHGLGLGDNFIAVLISNALMETDRFLRAVTETDREVSSSVYLGDLLATAYSPHSRNRTLGTMVGKGYRVEGALIEMDMIAEGHPASLGIHRINKKFNVPMPVAACTYRILHEGAVPSAEMHALADHIH